MSREEIEKATGGGLSNKDLADIVSAPFYFKQFNDTEDVCEFIHDFGLGEFKELVQKFESYKSKCMLRDIYAKEAEDIRKEYGILI